MKCVIEMQKMTYLYNGMHEKMMRHIRIIIFRYKNSSVF